MDDVLAVMDAAGSEEAAIAATLEGGPMARAVRRHPPRPDPVADPVRHVRALGLGAGLRLGLERGGARRRGWTQCVEHWGEGLVAGSVAGSRMGDPRFMEWAGRLERLAASPGTITRIFDLIGEFDVREVLPSIRVPTLVMHRRDDSFIKVEHSRYIAEHIPGARYVELEGTDNMFAVGRHRGDPRRDRGVPHRHPPRARARPHARHGDVHGHRGLHPARRRPGRPRLARPARAPRPAVPARARAPPRPRGQAHRATASWRPSTARRARSAARRRSPRPWRSSGLELRAGLHTGELRGDERRPGRPGGAHRRPGDVAAPTPARCSCRAPSRTSWWALESTSRTAARTSCAGCRGTGACSG